MNTNESMKLATENAYLYECFCALAKTEEFRQAVYSNYGLRFKT